MERIWVAALRQQWGIEAQLTRLDGEYDLNYRAKTATGECFILKVMRAGCDMALIDMQAAALGWVATAAPGLPMPRVVPTKSGVAIVSEPDDQGADRLIWLQTALPGLCYADFRPHSEGLIADLGRQSGRLARALKTFDHPALARDFKWDLMKAAWIVPELEVITDSGRHALLQDICNDFMALLPALEALPRQAVHNDLNDYNILASVEGGAPRVTGLIDFGDMCAAPRICDLAIAAAYVVLDHPAPEIALAALVANYHAEYPLTVAELDMLWPLLRMRLAKSVVNSTLMARAAPEDPYVTISQAPAWRFLEGAGAVEPALLRYRMRAACGLPLDDSAMRVADWLDTCRGSFAEVIGQSLVGAPTGALSVEASTTPRDPMAITDAEAASLGSEVFGPEDIWLGHYAEPRLIYTAKEFWLGPWTASNRRTVHLGVDIFAPAGTSVRAPLDGTVTFFENRTKSLDYGGMVVLIHETPDGDMFHTLYGHLDPDCCSTLQQGQRVAAGEAFAKLGSVDCNGGWAPHLHFQLALTLEGMGTDWPAVADVDDMALWGAICPNPAVLLNLEDGDVAYRGPDKAHVRKVRREHFGGNLALSYSDPVMLLRGWRHYMFDEWGRPYLDAYNNVPHVGHAHPRLAAIAADQLKRMNSNTRYLHPAQAAFAETLLAKLPDSLSVCWFVNSGSEANELALRLARAASGGIGMVTPDHGYHGNTTGAIAVSAYKFNAPGGVGKPDWVELVDIPDDYRGAFRREGEAPGAAYAAQVDGALSRLAASGHKLAGFIAETYPSVGGQIIPPKGYLRGVYARIRAAGGVCIADEVQTGLGRLGSHYFAFEEQGVVPDIVVLGKPIGNGHPIGVVISTREVAEAFAQGPEFFSTFGGSTLSCRIGKAVLDIVDEEGLMQNAAARGAELMAGLGTLAARHPLIGDIRGSGLFIGVEMVTDRDSRSPATRQTGYILDRMREERILIGSEGPDHNILKIRPPLTVGGRDIEMLLDRLDAIMGETGSQP
ncbi:MAG: aminotransferase class III-fold pyridoxal phosphate-dependent enzyme [Roseovarius sp.]|nr:aminotransferase class III-fold pyridoxal phosphate-dependent enzyme [Roseovarius sp.]